MNLKEMLEKDLIEAMKAHEKERLTVIRAVKSAVKLEEIDHKKEPTDELVIEIVSRQIKQRKESIVEFQKGDRQDLIEKTEAEIQILEKYLPEQLTEAEIQKIIEDAFAKVQPAAPSDMGKIMKEITPLIKGKADMREVSNLIKEKLSA